MPSHKKTKRILDTNWGTIQQLRQDGVSVKDIATAYGVSRQVLEARFKKKQIVSTEINPMLKMLVLDIETSPFTAYSYNRWQVNISDLMRRDDDITILSYAYKWIGSDEVFYEENRDNCDKAILEKLSKVLDEADIVIGHNMQRFDAPMINTRLAMNGLPPTSPYRVVDTLKIAKKHYKFEKNSLDWVARSLKCSRKLEHKNFPGMAIWIEMLHGNDEAWAENKAYNKMDVVVTEEIYYKMRAFTKPHPSIVIGADSSSKRCVTCGSKDLTEDGYHYTNTSKFKRYKCANCGSFSRARKNLLTKDAKDNLLAPVTGV